jgi:hypothetical protein
VTKLRCDVLIVVYMITLGRRSIVKSEIDRSKIFQSCCEKSWMVLDLIKDNFSILEEGSSKGSQVRELIPSWC